MYNVKTYNKIDSNGLSLLEEESFNINSENDPNIILCRSQKLHEVPIPDSVIAIGRAGAGVNNIPVDQCTDKGIVVFNTPGANANAVKELVITGMLMSARNIYQGIRYVTSLDIKRDNISDNVEKNKSKFKGTELKGKKLGIIGLGAIGVLVANDADKFGLQVTGYDPYLSVNNAWGLSTTVKQADNLNQLLSDSDFISIHMPLNDNTRGFLDSNKIALLKNSATILNFSRSEIIDNDAIIDALKTNRIYKYVSDFPTNELIQLPNYLGFPHLGASTLEAETNCSTMIASQIKDYAINGNIVNSVNYPNCSLQRGSNPRITISNKNVPNMVGQITSVLANHNINILEMINKSKGDLAYTILDISTEASDTVLNDLRSIQGVYTLRYFTA